MHSYTRISELRGRLARWRHAGETVALVPTMGNLHAGHLDLIKEAQQSARRVVATIFVNPVQFVAGEDYASYPRTLDADRKALADAGVDALFHPEVDEIYPDGVPQATHVSVTGLDGILCGKFRPGHFAGVATVVTKLFVIVQPDVAVFGLKDYQQLLVIRRLARELNFPVTITGVETVREEDGLALSSRNQYLSGAERRTAPLLYQSLRHIASAIEAGVVNYSTLEQAAAGELDSAGFRVEYVSVRDAATLGDPAPGADLVALAAAWLGPARLIDNVVIGR